ncbi:MAG: ABC transporter ATP-binding protein, partial [Clostridia bacterium]|nr:ABC transporter ATP-binding protein [Clostridia bacterium]
MKKTSFFSELIKGHRIRFSIAVFTKICTTILGIGLTYVIKYIVDTVFYSKSFKLLIGVLILFLGLRLLIMVLTYFSSYSLNYIGQKIAFDLRQKGFKKILSLDFKYFDSHRTGDLMTRMTSDIDFVQSFYSAALPNTISQAIAFVSSLFMMLFSGGPLVLMLLLFVLPTLAILAATLSKEIRPAHKRIREMRARLNTVVQENISANRVVKAFCNENFETEKLKRANSDFKNANIKANDISRKYGPVMGKLHDLFNLYIIVVGGILTIKGYMTVGEIVMFNSLVWRVTAPLTTFSNVVNEFSNISASGDKIKEFLNEQPEITNHPEIKKEKLFGDIFFDH